MQINCDILVLFLLFHANEFCLFCIKFVGIEGVVTGIVDLFPRHLRRGHRKELFTAFVCCIWFLLGLSMVTEVKDGMYNGSDLISVYSLSQLHKGLVCS